MDIEIVLEEKDIIINPKWISRQVLAEDWTPELVQAIKTKMVSQGQ